MTEMFKAFKHELEEVVGFETAKTVNDVNENSIHYFEVSETFLVVTCTETSEPYVSALKKTVPDQFIIKVIVKGEKPSGFTGRKQRPAAGNGFGANLFRLNHEKNSVELSFGGKPSPEIREKLKERGFRWSHTEGVWYISLSRYDAEKHGDLVEFCVVELKLGNAPSVGEAKK